MFLSFKEFFFEKQIQELIMKWIMSKGVEYAITKLCSDKFIIFIILILI